MKKKRKKKKKMKKTGGKPQLPVGACGLVSFITE
jgi:hypothetical protein